MRGLFSKVIRTILCFALSLAAALTITSFASAGSSNSYAEQPIFEIEGMDHSGEVGPGDTVDLSPYAKNTGAGSIYLCATIRQGIADSPKFKDGYDYDDLTIHGTESVPIYTYTVNKEWELVDESIADGYIEDTYVYTKSLSANQTTTPVFNTATMLQFTNPYFGTKIQDINITVDFSAVPSDGKDATVSDIWALIQHYKY